MSVIACRASALTPAPNPVVLEGIAGEFAMIRAPNGKTGLVPVGGTFEGVKVLAMAQNRALVEHGGEKKELVIHGGLGSESFLPKKPAESAPKTGAAAATAAPESAAKAPPPGKTP